MTQTNSPSRTVNASERAECRTPPKVRRPSRYSTAEVRRGVDLELLQHVKDCGWLSGLHFSLFKTFGRPEDYTAYRAWKRMQVEAMQARDRDEAEHLDNGVDFFAVQGLRDSLKLRGATA